MTDDMLGDPVDRAKLDRFVREIVKAVPALEPALEEHLDFMGGLHSHMFFGDVVRWAQGEAEKSPPSQDLKQLLLILDLAYPRADVRIRELVAFSFIENIDRTSPLRSQLLPNLKALDDEFRHGAGGWIYG